MKSQCYWSEFEVNMLLPLRLPHSLFHCTLGDHLPVEVSGIMVRCVVENMDKCDQRDVQLSENAMQNINDLFLKVCRLALTGPTLSSLSLPSCSISQSPSHTSLKSSLPPPSPSQTKRRKKKFVRIYYNLVR